MDEGSPAVVLQRLAVSLEEKRDVMAFLRSAGQLEVSHHFACNPHVCNEQSSLSTMADAEMSQWRSPPAFFYVWLVLGYLQSCQADLAEKALHRLAKASTPRAACHSAFVHGTSADVDEEEEEEEDDTVRTLHVVLREYHRCHFASAFHALMKASQVDRPLSVALTHSVCSLSGDQSFQTSCLEATRILLEMALDALATCHSETSTSFFFCTLGTVADELRISLSQLQERLERHAKRVAGSPARLDAPDHVPVDGVSRTDSIATLVVSTMRAVAGVSVPWTTTNTNSPSKAGESEVADLTG